MKNELKYINMIGSGYFCHVKKYKNESNGNYCAIKELKNGHYPNDNYRYRLLREIELLKELKDCEFIIDLYDHGNNKKEKKLWYSMPFAHNNLYNFIKNNNSNLEKEKRYDIARQVISAIKFAHSKNILHRDISPNNILLFNVGNSIQIKVADFGLGKDQASLSYFTTSSISGYGQILYVAPEQRNNLKDATVRSDIYSLGKLIYFIFTAKDPDNIKQFELSSLVSKSIEDNPNDRFSNIAEFEHHFESLRILQKDHKIPFEHITLKEIINITDKIDWLQFHQLAVNGNYSNHVYYDYIEPTISFLEKNGNLNKYYKAIGSDFKSFVDTFSKRLDECYSTTSWPFSALNTFGLFLKKIIEMVDDAYVRLICFKNLWHLAYEADQWVVQSAIKKILNKKYISPEMEIPFADYIQNCATEIDFSQFDSLELPQIIKYSILQSNEAFKKQQEERQKKINGVEDPF